MTISISYELKLDTLRNNTFAGTYDDISNYLISLSSSAGFTQGQDALRAISEPLAPPAQMQLVLSNKSKVFHQETLGSEALTNGTFTNWTANNPDSWTVTGEVSTDPEISQVGIEAAHGGTGSGALNIYSSSATVSIEQTALTVGNAYLLTIIIGRVVNGTIALYNGATKIGVYAEEGTFTENFIASATTLKLQNFTAACDVTVDSISVKQTARYSGLLRPGVLIRWRATYGSTQQLFIGKITEGGITYGVNDKSAEISDQSVSVIVQDAMLDMVDIEYAPPLLTNVTTDAVLQRFFDDNVIAWPYASSSGMIGVSGAAELDTTLILASYANISLETGKTTFTFSGNVADRGKGIQAQQYIRDIVMAEGGGRFYFEPRTGYWIFHNRHHDSSISTVSATVDATAIEAMHYIYGDDLVNRITINYTSKEVGAPASTLYRSQTNPIRIDGNTTRKLTGRYLVDGAGSDKRIGGYNFLPINSPPLYDVAADSGQSLPFTEAYTISADAKATSVEITIENKGLSPLYVFNLRFAGTPLIWYDESVTLFDPHSVRKYDQRNKQPITIKMIDDPNFAYALAQSIISRYSTPISRVESIGFSANLNATLAGHMINRKIGDRISLTSTNMNHASDYVIVGEGHTLMAETRNHSVMWYLKPVNRETVWVLDATGKSEFNSTTRLTL